MIGLVTAEIILRFIRPEYKKLTQSFYSEHDQRRFANPKKTTILVKHPDLAQSHEVTYNSMGLRQSREFSVVPREDVIRIGVFGDSFTENTLMESKYVFTEPLNYLLNETGGKYEVLNFGTSGYGTDQVYLRYFEAENRQRLNIVIYLYYRNDLPEILANRLVEIDDKGAIVLLPPSPQKTLKKMVSRFYLTYLVLSTIRQFDRDWSFTLDTDIDRESIRARERKFKDLLELRGSKEPDQRIVKAEKLFSALVHSMDEDAKKNGSRFVVFFAPDSRKIFRAHNARMAQLVDSLNIMQVDLFSCYYDDQDNCKDRLFFKNDSHWNEEGNEVAAIQMFKFLANLLKIEYQGDAFVHQALNTYYRSVCEENDCRVPISNIVSIPSEKNKEKL